MRDTIAPSGRICRRAPNRLHDKAVFADYPLALTAGRKAASRVGSSDVFGIAEVSERFLEVNSHQSA
ncbi:MAG TPA: hypothetical protein VFV87_19730 [Pirellulaceae bacterium]|nr:hypothetical protein [Pirellulaceae bacterium]